MKKDKLDELRVKLADYGPIYRRIKFLPTTGNIDLIILKGHLLLEEMLLLLVAKNVEYPSAIEEINNLGFSTLLKFAKALKYSSNDFDWVWEAIENFNSIRNTLAHKLEAEGLHQKIDDLLTLIDSNFWGYTVKMHDAGGGDKSDLPTRLSQAIDLLCDIVQLLSQ